MQKHSDSSLLAEKRIPPTLHQDAIQQQVERILSSEEFQATKQQRDFFRFIIKETLAGRSQGIKGYQVATEVFGRSSAFDTNTDPIVSIQANKLRRALERYYLITGDQDPILINIPKGGYVPVFTKQNALDSGIPPVRQKSEEEMDAGWPSVLILPFQNMTGEKDNHIIGTSFASELATEIARTQEITVRFQGENPVTSFTAMKSRFLLGGNIYKTETGIKVNSYLKGVRSGEQIFGDSLQTDVGPVHFLAFQENIVRTIACKISCDFGTIASHIASESKDKSLDTLTPFEAILRFYEFEKTMTPENFRRAHEALHHAAAINPDCGLIWSMLALLYTILYGADVPGFEDSLEKAMEYGERGVRIKPNNQKTVGILGWVHFFNNDLTFALEYIDRAIALNPESLVFMDRLGYALALLGEWDRGCALIRKGIRNNPYYAPSVHYALWLDCLRRKDYERAYLETMGLVGSSLFWVPLAKASTLGLLERYDEGRKFAEQLLELRPDFPTRGRILIERYIKFDAIADRVIEGLTKVSLKIT